MKCQSFILLPAACVVCATVCVAQNLTFTYQGQLNDTGNAAIGQYDFRFQLFASAAGGTSLGSVDIENKPVTNGLFTVELSFSGSALDGSDRWLQIEVREADSNGNHTVLTPRAKLHPTPYAFFAQKVAWSGISGLPEDFADGVDDNTTYSAGTGLSLAGTTFSIAPGGVDGSMLANQSVTLAKLDPAGASPGQALTLHNSILSWSNPTAAGLLLPFSASLAEEDNALIRITNLALDGNANAYYGETASQFGSAIFGLASNGGIGLEGVALGNGGAGVFGRSSGADGKGVYAESTGMSGYGVYGLATSTNGNAVGLYGQSDSVNGIGVEALATGNKGIGVFSKASSSSSGVTYGVWGQSDSPSGIGIHGLANATTGFAIGIEGRTKSPDGIGVFGVASAAGGGIGVLGIAVASPTGIGVSGVAGGNGDSYGVAGTSSSTHQNAAGIFAEGGGTTSPGVPQAAALEIKNGAIRVSGGKRPAGTIQVANEPMNPLIGCVTQCPDCGHTHTIGWYQDVLLQNELIVSNSIVLATVETTIAPLRVSYSVQVFDKQPGSSSLRVTAMGSNNSECSQPIDNIRIHYQIINPFPDGE